MAQTPPSPDRSGHRRGRHEAGPDRRPGRAGDAVGRRPGWWSGTWPGEERVAGIARLRHPAPRRLGDSAPGRSSRSAPSPRYSPGCSGRPGRGRRRRAGRPAGRYLPASVAVPRSSGEITLGDLSSHAGGLGRNPKGCWAGGWRTAQPVRGLSVEDVHEGLALTRLWRDPANGPATPTSAPGCWARRWSRPPASPTSSWSGSGSACPWAYPTPSSPPPRSRPRGWPSATRAGPAGGAVRAPGAARRRGAALHGPRHAAVPGGQPRPGPHPPGGPARTHPAAPAPDGPGDAGGARLADRPLPRPAGPLLWHNGGTNGFRSFAAVTRDRGIAVVVLSNTARSVDRLGLRLVRELSAGAGWSHPPGRA